MPNTLCALLAVLLNLCAADWNSEYIRYRNCHPSACSVDGVCYCTDKQNGWYDGGSGYSRSTRSSEQSLCYKAGQGDCECADCGQIALFPNVQCQDLRCDDETDRTVTGPFGADRGQHCFRIDPEKGKVFTDRRWYFNCYKTRLPCEPLKCEHGQTLKGCMRVSAGTCESCGPLKPGHYWTTRGGCGMAACDVVQPGYYMIAPCGNITNSVKAHCSEHIGNPRAPAFANPVPQYYCPGGNNPPVRVPSYGRVNADFADFSCEEGYSKEGPECRACLPGSACLHGRSYTCPSDYFTDRYAQKSCKRCTSVCTFKSELPMRCQEGSNQNSRCVTCGACGLWPATGVNCVRDIAEFAKKPETCTPRNELSTVAVCQEV